MMAISNRIVVPGLGALCAAMLLAGCATGPKRLEPVSAAQEQKGQGEFLKGMEVVEKPELEPEWADFVKDRYPHWRRHYWVDRGE